MGGRSLLLLAWHFLRHVLRKVTLTYDRGGSTRFLENYRDDGLAPVRREDRQAVARWQSCIGCGLCDAVCHPEQPASLVVLLAAGARDLSTLDASALDASRWACGSCDGCSSICPVGVPIAEAVSFLQRGRSESVTGV